MRHHQVVIIGAGPAGLVLARMLANQQIDCVVLENRNEAFLRQNNRGGFLESKVAQLLQRENLNCQIKEQGKVIKQIHFHIAGEKSILPISEKAPIIYDQKRVAADLIASLKVDKIPIIFEAKGQRYEGLDGKQVKIIYTLDGQIHSMTADYVAGCDGFRGISRRSIPKKLRQEVQEELPYAWLEWLIEEEVAVKHPIIACSKDGLAMQAPAVNGQTRYYLQVKRGIEIDDLPSDEDIWNIFESRIGSIVERRTMLHKKLDYMRSFYTDTMQYGRLLIAGDAAHQVPRLGSKGINMAITDAAKLATSFYRHFKNNDSALLNNYTQDCLKENVKIIEYSNYLNHLFHKKEEGNFDTQINQIKNLLTDDQQKSKLLAYLIG